MEKKIVIRSCYDMLGVELGVEVFVLEGQNILRGDTWVYFEKHGAVKPTLYLPEEYLPLLLNALQDRGVKLPEESKVRGLYEAQTAHLKDLRTLLKLK